MTVKLITGKGDAADGRNFQPIYTHQVFRVKATDDADPIHEEFIIGYGAFPHSSDRKHFLAGEPASASARTRLSSWTWRKYVYIYTHPTIMLRLSG